MRISLRVAWIVALALLAAPVLRAETVAGVDFPDRIELTPGGDPLVRNGAGVRTFFLFDVYAMALYLPRATTSADEAIASLGSKRVAMQMLRDVEAKEFVDALTTALKANHTEQQMQAFAPQIARLTQIMTSRGSVKEGTRVTLDLLPGVGTAVVIDGVPQGAPIPGEDFYRALLRNWIGEHPVSEKLKSGLLRGR